MRRWPLDRWVVVVGGHGATHQTLADAKEYAARWRQRGTGRGMKKFPKDCGWWSNAVIVLAGGDSTYRGKLNPERTGYRWTKERARQSERRRNRRTR
jgi:hypothetical protein